MKYDDVDWHDGVLGVTTEQAVAHLALFLRWCDRKGFVSDFLRDESDGMLAAAQRGEATYSDLILEQCDGKLMSDFLSDEGNAFAAVYYEKGYSSDWQSCFGDLSYAKEEAAYDHEALFKILDQRLDQFKAGTWSPPKK